MNLIITNGSVRSLIKILLPLPPPIYIYIYAYINLSFFLLVSIHGYLNPVDRFDQLQFDLVCMCLLIGIICFFGSKSPTIHIYKCVFDVNSWILINSFLSLSLSLFFFLYIHYYFNLVFLISLLLHMIMMKVFLNYNYQN